MIIEDNIKIRAIDFDEYLINEFEIPLKLFIEKQIILLCDILTKLENRKI